jgi:hypothetical protein
MANVLYASGKKKILDADIDFLVNDIRFLLQDVNDDAFDANNVFVSDLVAGSIVARMAAALSTPTTTAGTFDAVDPTINSVTGDPIEAVILYMFNASDAAAPLIAYIDASPTISFTPNGSNVTLTLDALGIFSI